jgi:DNA-binding transcriptional LysR family regulator
LKLSSEDLIFFQAISGSRSLADAARFLGVSAAAVTGRLKNLETRLGLRLLDRSSRRMLFTDEGELLRTRAKMVMAELAALEEELEARRGTVSGTLRIIAPIGFGRAYVATAVTQFRVQHPAVQVELTLSDHLGRRPSESWDLAIHIGELPDTRLLIQTVAPNERWLCASPSYVAQHGIPIDPADLKHHDCIALRENDEDVTRWRFGSGQRMIVVRIKPTMACNDGDVIREWARQGKGVILRSEWHVAEDIVAGRLVRLLAQYPTPPAPVVVLTGVRTELSARARLFIAHLKDALSLPPWRKHRSLGRSGKPTISKNS